MDVLTLNGLLRREQEVGAVLLASKSDFRASLRDRSQEEEAAGEHVHNITDLLLTLEESQKVAGMISPMIYG